MIEFETSECALVRYERTGDASVRVVIEGYLFGRKAWDELTAELFPPHNFYTFDRYTLDPDVWLPSLPFKGGTATNHCPHCPTDPKKPCLRPCRTVYEEMYGRSP